MGTSSDDIDYYGELYAFGRNEVNQPPDPPVITGETIGRVNTTYRFNFSAHDPDLDDVLFFVDWGDGTDTGWIGPYDSDMVITLDHLWSEKGTFELKAKARDIFGYEGNWSTIHVTMPKVKSGLSFLEERFPILFNFRSLP